MLLHELGNHTQYLMACNALLKSGGPVPDDAHLARTGAEVEELGWLLGLCAGGFGHDLLRARRRDGGLGVLVRAIRAALRREQRDLPEPDAPLAPVDQALPWPTVWTVGELLLAAARAQPGRCAWSAARTARGLELTVDAPGPLACARATLEREDGRLRAVFPLGSGG